MKTFTNKKGISYVLLAVPEDYQTGKCYGNQFNYWTEKHPYNDCFPTLVSLPQGNYGLIGLAKYVSESQAAEMMDKGFNAYDEETFRLYDDVVVNGCYVVSAQESLSSLVQSLGLNNPVILKKI